ncbi:unnamed protein product, partial [marine sediment metagenome]
SFIRKDKLDGTESSYIPPNLTKGNFVYNLVTRHRPQESTRDSRRASLFWPKMQ